MGKLSTHVLDTMHGTPASGVVIDLYILEDNQRAHLLRVQTNADGRCDQPLLQDQALVKGRYELVFHIGDYFQDKGVPLPEPSFLDQVTINFGVADCTQNYHVPLVVTPWSYSTYRGS